MGCTTNLLDRWQDGRDNKALGEIFERKLSFVKVYAGRALRRPLARHIDSDDVTQETFLRFYHHQPSYRLRSGQHLMSFLIQQIKHVLSNRHDRFSADKRVVKKGDPAAPKPVEPPDPCEMLETRERLSQLDRAIETLSVEEQELVNFRLLDRTLAEVAAHLGCKPDAARMRTNRALAKLKDRMRATDT